MNTKNEWTQYVPEKMPIQTQYRHILMGRESDQVHTESFRIVRMGIIAEHTGWNYAEINTIEEDEQVKLATFFSVKEQFDRGESKVEHLLSNIADYLKDISRRNENPELLSWTVQKRIRTLVDALIGPEVNEDGEVKYEDIGSLTKVPLLQLLESALRHPVR